MATKVDGHIISEGERAGWIECGKCKAQYGLLPTPDEIAASHTEDQGFNPPDFVSNQGCTRVPTPDGCEIDCPRSEVFAYYKKLGADHVHDAADDTPATSAFKVG